MVRAVPGAWQSTSCERDTPGSPIGMLYDECQETLVQYCDFLLASFTPASSYMEVVPSLTELNGKYKLEPEVCFMVYRPIFHEIVTSAIPRKDQRDRQVDLGGQSTTWNELLGMVEGMLPAPTWNALSAELYFTFWSLTLYDLHVPRARYDAEIARQKSNISSLEESRASLEDRSAESTSKRRKERERLLTVVEKLENELKEQERHVNLVDARLQREKDSWLQDCKEASRPDTVVEFLQNCIFPRVMFTMQDAVFCAKFVEKLHELDTTHFSTLQYYDRVLKDLTQAVASCTENEAARMGRFLSETLSLLDRWKSDEKVYADECQSRAGFCTTFTDPKSKRATYSDYVRVSYRWHTRMTKALGACLDSKEYMHIRNALVVLDKIYRVFPRIHKHAVHIQKRVEKIRDLDDREDLQTIAKSYFAKLMMERPKMVSDSEFMPYESERQAPAVGAPRAVVGPGAGYDRDEVMAAEDPPATNSARSAAAEKRGGAEPGGKEASKDPQARGAAGASNGADAGRRDAPSARGGAGNSARASSALATASAAAAEANKSPPAPDAKSTGSKTSSQSDVKPSLATPGAAAGRWRGGDGTGAAASPIEDGDGRSAKRVKEDPGEIRPPPGLDTGKRAEREEKKESHRGEEKGVHRDKGKEREEKYSEKAKIPDKVSNREKEKVKEQSDREKRRTEGTGEVKRRRDMVEEEAPREHARISQRQEVVERDMKEKDRAKEDSKRRKIEHPPQIQPPVKETRGGEDKGGMSRKDSRDNRHGRVSRRS
ncbi:THO complex subunit 2 [Cymbomonas tetramitiformis]|uniref:THO complex subunit 2 n=1 Tax=Cymbomonas tetramitiformis TaxID=36881 RepID=A0AAE0FUB7_9CHLO|nr:THO complex subunit 2 [Cymbomonas tetramitiformis]